MKSLAQKTLVLFLSVALPLALGECVVRMQRPGFPGYRLPQIEHRPVEGYGFGIVPDQQGFTISEPATINSLGFRGPDLDEAAAALGPRVLALGDSFTFGFGVSDDEAYPRRLERLLAERLPERTPEVVNLGAQGYATYHEIDLLRRRGLALRPDAVLLAIYHNDLEVRPPGDYRATYEEAFTRERASIRHRMPLLYAAFHKSALFTLASNVYHARRMGSARDAMQEASAGSRADAVWDTMRDELTSLRDLAGRHGFVPLVFTIPARFELFSDAQDPRYPAEIYALCDSLGLPVAHLREPFLAAAESGVDLYLAWDHHLSADGNLILAERVADRLLEELGGGAAPEHP
jgi:hypothetical protein